MGVTMLPGPPQFGQGGGADTSGIVQLALAIKQYKNQQTQQKKADAQQKVAMLTQNPQLLMMTDPKDLEKALKEGYGINVTDQNLPQPGQGGGAPGGVSSIPMTPGLGNATPNSLAAVGNAVQGNKAGAQAGAPVSPTAANAAPGGGVNQTGTPQLVEQLAAKAQQDFTTKFGAVAPLYASAMSQIEQEQLKAKTINEIEGLKQNAASGDFRSMGRLYMLAGKDVTDADMRAMIASSNMDPKVVSQAMDFALGNETDADKAKRFDSTLKTLSSSPDFMGRLQNPTDITEIARSIVYGGKLPEGVGALRLQSLDELGKEADYEKYLTTEIGLPYDMAHTVARARSLGIDTNLSLPKGFQTLAQRKVGVTETEAGAAVTSAQAALIKSKSDMLKVTSEIQSLASDRLNDRLKSMIEARKAKHPFPDEVENGLINEVAREVGLQPEQVKKWYQYVTGGESWTYTPVPDSDLARAAAGGGDTTPSTGAPSGEKSVGQAAKGVYERFRQLQQYLQKQGVPQMVLPPSSEAGK